MLVCFGGPVTAELRWRGLLSVFLDKPFASCCYFGLFRAQHISCRPTKMPEVRKYTASQPSAAASIKRSVLQAKAWPCCSQHWNSMAIEASRLWHCRSRQAEHGEISAQSCSLDSGTNCADSFGGPSFQCPEDSSTDTIHLAFSCWHELSS